MLCKRSPKKAQDTYAETHDSAVQEYDLAPYLARSSFRIQTAEASRRISVYYEREADVLPGWKKVIKFNETIDQPLLW